MLLLGFRRGAAAGINSELLLIGCSSSAASVGQALLPAAVSSQRHAVSEVKDNTSYTGSLWESISNQGWEAVLRLNAQRH